MAHKTYLIMNLENRETAQISRKYQVLREWLVQAIIDQILN